MFRIIDSSKINQHILGQSSLCRNNGNIIIRIIILHWSHMQSLAPVLYLEDRMRKRSGFNNLFYHLSLIVCLLIFILFFCQLGLHLLINIILDIIVCSIYISNHNLLLLFFDFGIIITLFLFLIITIWKLILLAFLFLLKHIKEFLMFCCIAYFFV